MPAETFFYDKDIQVLTGIEAVRKRPFMYMGPLDEQSLPNRLLQEGMCLSIRPTRNGIVSLVRVILGPEEGSAVITDDGEGMPTDFIVYGDGTKVRKSVAILTQLYACRDLKEEGDSSHCSMGVVVLNAMCSRFDVRTWSGGHEWTQRFEGGQPTTDFIEGPATDRHGTEFSFTLDATLLPNRVFLADDLREWAKNAFGKATFEIVDQR